MGGGSEQRLLKPGPSRRQNGQRAVQVVIGPTAGDAAQGEAGEVRGAPGIVGTPGRELPYLARAADEWIQVAVDLDDLDQPGGTEFVEQVRGTEFRAEGDAAWCAQRA